MTLSHQSGPDDVLQDTCRVLRPNRESLCKSGHLGWEAIDNVLVFEKDDSTVPGSILVLDLVGPEFLLALCSGLSALDWSSRCNNALSPLRVLKWVSVILSQSSLCLDPETRTARDCWPLKDVGAYFTDFSMISWSWALLRVVLLVRL